MAAIRTRKKRPVGRDEVRRAVLRAAVGLFTRRGPASVSLRDIAAEANVNLGLLHRHFGSKAELIAAAVAHLAEQAGPEVADALAAPDLPGEVARLATSPSQRELVVADALKADVRAYIRMLGWLMLEGADPRTLQQTHPVLTRLAERLRANGRDDDDAKVDAAAIFALGLGWTLFEPFLRVAAGLDAVPAEHIQAMLATAIGRLAGHRDPTRP